MAVDRWYAVQTKPRCEDEVVHRLAQRGAVPVFLPKLEAMRRWRGRKVRTVEPLFPSYLFVRMTLEPQQWHAVKWTPGVKRIVGTDEVPVPVPDEAIEVLRARCREGDVVPWAPLLRLGAHVRITDGPFVGFEGILERAATRAERVRVLLMLLRTPASIEVDVVDLEEVSG
ncbi:MAG TPA: transcription termination/antitermination NusG family protein [bacterium]|jgi:transcription elongation factor/antiterminator RfaH|nr:transcription termination/antitermination NusG family protein [bacterium]